MVWLRLDPITNWNRIQRNGAVGLFHADCNLSGLKEGGLSVHKHGKPLNGSNNNPYNSSPSQLLFYPLDQKIVGNNYTWGFFFFFFKKQIELSFQQREDSI